LNKDDRADFAFVVSETEGGDESKAPLRKLIIALQADGLLHKSAESESAVALKNEPQLTIKKDVLIVENDSGHQRLTHKYQLRSGHWELIGFTENDTDTDGANATDSVDVNLLTGEVIGSSRTNKSYATRFLEVRSPLIDGPESSAADWTAPAVWLNAKSEKCPIVAVYSVHNKNTLFVRTELEGSFDIAEDEVDLVNHKGAVVPALTKKKTTYGYILATYDLKSLLINNAPAPDSDTQVEENKGDAPELLRISVKVTPAHCGCKKTFSTAQHGDAGGILLTKLKGLPTLADIDLRNGDAIHPKVRPLAETE
jgi:hypothetical protein